MHRMPVRWRLTLWYAALSALVMIVLGGIVFGTLRWRMNDAFDNELQDQAALAKDQVVVDRGIVDFGSIDPEPGAWTIDVLTGGSEDTAAEPATGESDEPVAGSSAVASALDGETTYVNFADETGDSVRAIVVPVLDESNTVVGALQVSGSRETLNTAIGELATTLAIVSPLMLLLAAGAGYLLAGRALRPVSHITTLAANIGANDLHERLNLALPNDELGRLAQTFDAMLERMEDAFARQTRFSGDAAHELRTPLTLMRGQIDLALNHPRTPAEYQEALGQLDLDLARITSLVETLLALSRADAGQLTPDLAPFDVAETIATVVEMYQSTACSSGITLRDASKPLTITADEDLVIQVLVNLVDNALAHTPPAGEITIGCEQRQHLAVIRVSDTGSGIPAEHQARVFDRFYRVTRSLQGGAGLGLAIARAIVENHGGAIRLESSESTGTTVELHLPIAP